MSPDPDEEVPVDLSIISLSGALGERLRLSEVNKSWLSTLLVFAHFEY